MGREHRSGSALSVSECAELLGVNERTVRNMISRGDLKAYQIGGRLIRVAQSDFDDLWKPVRGGAFE